MTSFLRKWLTGRPQTRPAAPKTRLNVESLDRRDLPAGITLSSSGLLSMIGSENVESASVWMEDGYVHARMTSTPVGGSFGIVYSKTYLPGAVDEIVFGGGGANDTFSNTTFYPAYVYGDAGDDSLTGGNGADMLYGGAGNDTIKGGVGGDTIYGNAGNDILHGNSGADTIYGGDHNDQLYGGSSNDVLYGENGDDRIVSVGGGTDTQTGGGGLDSHWLDTTDTLTDSAFEDMLKRVHRIDQFYRYTFDNGVTSEHVSKELNGQNLTDPRQTDAHEQLLFNNFTTNVGNKPLFRSTGPHMDDVHQGTVGDCYLMAGLSGLARSHPEFIKQMVVDLGDGTYAVRFYSNGQPQHVRVDGDMWTDNYGTLRYARLGGDGANWVPIVEKAWAFFRRNLGSYESIRGGDTLADAPALGVTWERLTKTQTPSAQQVYDWFHSGSPAGTLANQIRGGAEAWLHQVKAALNAGKTVRVGGPGGIADDTAILIDNPSTDEVEDSTYWHSSHVYTADAVLTDAHGNVTGLRLRDPYGSNRTLTDMTRIYYCLSPGDAWYP